MSGGELTEIGAVEEVKGIGCGVGWIEGGLEDA